MKKASDTGGGNQAQTRRGGERYTLRLAYLLFSESGVMGRSFLHRVSGYGSFLNVIPCGVRV